MPKFNYPAEKMWDCGEEEEMMQPTLYLKVSPEQLDGLEIGDSVRVTVVGTVSELSLRQTTEEERSSMEISMMSSDVENIMQENRESNFVNDMVSR